MPIISSYSDHISVRTSISDETSMGVLNERSAIGSDSGAAGSRFSSCSLGLSAISLPNKNADEQLTLGRQMLNQGVTITYLMRKSCLSRSFTGMLTSTVMAKN